MGLKLQKMSGITSLYNCSFAIHFIEKLLKIYTLIPIHGTFVYLFLIKLAFKKSMLGFLH